MELGLQGRLVCVSGASQGIGQAIAAGFAAEGARLALCSRHREKLEQTAEQLRRTYDTTVSIAAVDVQDSKSLSAWIQSAANDHGRMDVCVCNAGGPPARAILDTTEEEWQAAFETTLRSVIVQAQAALPLMKKNQWGRFLTISSVAVRQPIPALVYSNTLRTGLLGLVRTLASEFGPYGITVNNIAPGYTATARLDELARHSAEEKGTTIDAIHAEWTRDVPAGRLGTPEEIAAAAVWLASEQSAFITGQTLVVDGGMYKGI
jgi:3-oxoacyl-[acyl-carrier protein] reductase